MAAPGKIGMEKLAAQMRNDLRLLTENLGEDVPGGHRHLRDPDVPYRTSKLEEYRSSKLEEASQAEFERIRDYRVKEWFTLGPGRVEVLLCLHAEAWHLLDYSLAYRSLEVVSRAAAYICHDSVRNQSWAGQPAQDWEGSALLAVTQAISLITTDATLFKLINLSSAEGLKAEAERAVKAAGDTASALKALDAPPFQTDDRNLLAEKLKKIKDDAEQNKAFYEALVHAAEALIKFERWLEKAPRVTFGRTAAAVTWRATIGCWRRRRDRHSDTEQALGSIDAAIRYFRDVQDRINDWLILSRCEPWERLLVQIREIVAPSVPSAVSGVFVPNRVSVRYIYPFAVEADEAVGNLLNDGNLLNEPTRKFFDQVKVNLDDQFTDIGITVGELKVLELTEFFTRCSGLYGIRVDLPDLVFRDQLPPGPGGDGRKLTAWLNLSSMGDHCLCIELKEDLVEPLPHVLYRIIRAGTPVAVGATVAVGAPTGAAWDNLHFYSRDVITAVAGAKFWCVDADLPVTQRLIRGNLHEIVVVRTEDPLGTHPLEVARNLDRAVGGRILGRSIQRAAATLEEWVRYPPMPGTGTAGQAAASTIAGIPEMGLAGDWCAHTGETTVFGIVAAPSWQSDIYVEAAQFANSWSPQLQLWSRRLRSIIESLEADSHDPEGPEQLRQIETRVLQLRQIERRVRLHLAQINTEELTATLAHRRFLDQLLGMAGLSRLQAELEAELEAAERLTDWFNQEARQKADARRQVLLGWIALFGLFGVTGFLALANSTAFHLGILSFTEQASWEGWVIVALLVVAVLVGFYFYNKRVERLVRKVGSRVRRKDHHEHPDTGPADPHGHEPHRGRLSGHS